MNNKIYGIIYKIKNKINDKIYIGQTIHSLKKRVNEHLNKTGCRKIHYALLKYSIDTFNISVIDNANSIEELNNLEQKYIKQFNSLHPNGYNLTTGGNQNIMCQETREKLSKSKLKNKNPMYGKPVSKETREKLSEAHSGEKNHFYGKTHTEETKKKMANAKKGTTKSEEFKIKMSKRMTGTNHPFYGKHRTEESKRKISESSKGKIYSSKLTKEEAAEIKHLFAKNVNRANIAKLYNISARHVYFIGAGKSWKEVTI